MALMEYMHAKRLLDRYAIHSIPSKYVFDAEDAVAFAGGKSIAMKLISGKALHKSKAGLVKLNLNSKEDIERAYADLRERGRSIKQYKIIAQKMAEPGVESIIGGNTDAQFGKMLLIGLGGIYVETFGDTQLRLCPITKNDAIDMINNLRSKDILTSGGKSLDMLAGLLMKTSRLLVGNPKIRELDLNPVILRDSSYDVVDIRVLL